MISRLIAPTKDTVEVMRLMGVEVASTAFQSQKGFEKIITLATAFNKLEQSQKNLVLSVIASRWQVNRFGILMEQVNDPTSAFWRAMNETGDAARNTQIYMKMLNTTLMSSPKGLQIVTNAIKNSLAAAMIDIIPVITALLAHVAQITDWFTNLDPAVQQLALGFLFATAMLGPLLRYFGAMAQIMGLGLKLVNFMTIAFSREAAAKIVSANASAAATVAALTEAGAHEAAAAASMQHAASQSFLANGLARVRLGIGNLLGGLFSLIAFPFKVVAAGVGFMWRQFLQLVPMVISGIGSVMTWLWNLPIVTNTVGALVGRVGTLISGAWSAAASVAGMAWTAFTSFMATVPAMLSGLWSGAIAAIQTAWSVAPTAIGLAWIAFSSFMGTVWTGIQVAALTAGQMIQAMWVALPGTASAVGATIGAAWNGAAAAAYIAWEGFVATVTGLWRALPVMAWGAGQAIGLAWNAAAAAAYIAWEGFVAVVVGMWKALPVAAWGAGQSISIAWSGATASAYVVWEGFVTGVVALWRTLPMFAGIVGQAIGIAWTAASTAATVIWTNFITGIGAVWRTMPVVAGIIGQATGIAWNGAMVAMHGVWLTIVAAMETAWTVLGVALITVWGAIQAAISTLMSLLPAAWALVTGLLQTIWVAGTNLMVGIWSVGVSSIIILMTALPVIASAVMGAIVAVMTSPWTLVIAAVALFIYAFRDRIWEGIRQVIDGFNKMPAAMVAPFTRVIDVIKRAVMIARELARATSTRSLVTRLHSLTRSSLASTSSPASTAA